MNVMIRMYDSLEWYNDQTDSEYTELALIPTLVLQRLLHVIYCIG